MIAAAAAMIVVAVAITCNFGFCALSLSLSQPGPMATYHIISEKGNLSVVALIRSFLSAFRWFCFSLVVVDSMAFPVTGKGV